MAKKKASKRKVTKKKTKDAVARPEPKSPAALRYEELSGRIADFEDTFMRLAPSMGATPIRVIATVQNSLRKNPELLGCTAASIVASAMQCAILGLEPDGVLGFAHLVPFYNKKRGVKEAQIIIGYRGFISLALRSGHVVAITPRLVKENDVLFDFDEGDRGYIKHKRALKDRGDVVAGYCLGQLPAANVNDKFILMDRDQLDAVKARWESRNDVWKTHTESMWEKTTIRKLCKTLGFTAEHNSKLLGRAVQLDEMAENSLGQNHLRFGNPDALPTPKALEEYEGATADDQKPSRKSA